LNNLKPFMFFDEVTATGTSNTLVVANRGEVLSLEVRGTAIAFNLKVQGILDANNTNSWTDLGWFTPTFTKGTSIIAKGIYTVPVYLKTRIVIESISGGNLTVFGMVGE